MSFLQRPGPHHCHRLTPQPALAPSCCSLPFNGTNHNSTVIFLQCCFAIKMCTQESRRNTHSSGFSKGAGSRLNCTLSTCMPSCHAWVSIATSVLLPADTHIRSSDDNASVWVTSTSLPGFVLAQPHLLWARKEGTSRGSTLLLFQMSS